MPDPKDEDKPLNRRSFFRDGFFELLRPLSKPIARKLAPIEHIANQLQQWDEGYLSPPPKPQQAYGTAAYNTQSLPVLRPPGALAEDKFIEACTKCGHCVSVCPAGAIQLDEFGSKGNGAPFIDPDLQACVVCDGLFCMRECPSEALGYLPRWLIDMGTAEWHPDTCLRTVQGDSCTACVDQCPIGSEAIELKDNVIQVKEQGCTGCGVCQYYCPTYPKSITITPKAQKVADLKALNG